MTPIFLKIPYDFSFTLTEKLFGRVRRLAAVYEELSFDDDVPRSAVGDVDDGGLLRHNVKQHPPTIPARLLNCALLLTHGYQIIFDEKPPKFAKIATLTAINNCFLA